MTEEDKEKKKLYLFLSPDEEEKKYGAVGVIDEHLYYGKITGDDMRETLIFDDGRVVRNSKSEIVVSGEKVPVGRNEVEEMMGYTPRMGEIMPYWRNSSIREFLSGVRVDTEQIYVMVRDTIDKFMDFGPGMYGAADTQACWVIATYMYPVFEWFPHILLYGPAGSGKTKNGKLLIHISFGGYVLGISSNVTAPTLYRTLEENRGTILLDEYERIENSECQAILNQLLNSSTERDAYVIRLDSGRRKGDWRPRKFHVFSPKIVCNISGINPTSMTRFIPFHLIKTLDREKGDMKPEREKRKLYRIRDELHLFSLENWKKIKEIYDGMRVEMKNRDADNWKPILAVARFFGEDVEKKVLAYAESVRDVEIEANDVEYEVIHRIYHHVGDSVTRVSVRDVSQWCSDILTFTKSPESWIGRRLMRWKFKKIMVSGSTYYLLSREAVKSIIDRYYPLASEKQNTLGGGGRVIDDVVRSILQRGGMVAYDDLLAECVSEGFSGEEFERVFSYGLSRGWWYAPRAGYVSLISE